jgi:uncharacterized protein (DUF1697 family)
MARKLTAADVAEIVTRPALASNDFSKFDAWLRHYEMAVRSAEEWARICKHQHYSVGMQRTATRNWKRLQAEEKVMQEAYRAALKESARRREALYAVNGPLGPRTGF